ncbi:MAG: Fe-S cluster assembly ATPase SufC [Alphaproteobacteria bacterium]
MTPLLEIENLSVKVGDKLIIKNFDLIINHGEVHAIMGPNGAGKSTLSNVIAGKPNYEVVDGSIKFKGKNLLAMSIEERSLEGIFLSMQYPVEIEGVPVNVFLKHAVDAHRKHQNLEPLDTVSFMRTLKIEATKLMIAPQMLSRGLNVGFSGGEKKKLETLQMALLKPSFAILDEPDSGLDIDALKVVAHGVNSLREDNRSFLIITHYNRLLNEITPDFVHIFKDGKIIKTGGASLALELEESGYEQYGR